MSKRPLVAGVAGAVIALSSAGTAFACNGTSGSGGDYPGTYPSTSSSSTSSTSSTATSSTVRHHRRLHFRRA
jgi:hypothetical protein